MAKKRIPAVQPDLPAIEPAPPGPVVRGVAVLRPLTDVVANPWNPNRMTDHMFRSVVHGLKTDGWVASQALLVWGTDETGATRNTIIDGEHRWRAAQEAGFTAGPMVFLDGVSELEAKALTVKLNQKRGDWDDELLGPLLRELAEASPPDMSMDLGITEENLAWLIAPPEARPEEPGTAPTKPVEAPAEFQDLTGEGAIPTAYKCPRCAYCWSGAAK